MTSGDVHLTFDLPDELLTINIVSYLNVVGDIGTQTIQGCIDDEIQGSLYAGTIEGTVDAGSLDGMAGTVTFTGNIDPEKVGD